MGLLVSLFLSDVAGPLCQVLLALGDGSIKEHQGDFFSGFPQRTSENTCASLAQCPGAWPRP
jgi:hypothetical protein